MIGEIHPFAMRSLNALDENGLEGCATCGRPRWAHPDGETAGTEQTVRAEPAGKLTAALAGLGREPDADVRPALGQALAAEEVAWERWYAPCTDMAAAMDTSPYDLEREAFRAGWNARGGKP